MVVFVAFALMLNAVKASCLAMRRGCLRIVTPEQGRLFLPKDTWELACACACACASVELEALSVAFFGSRHEYEVGC